MKSMKSSRASADTRGQSGSESKSPNTTTTAGDDKAFAEAEGSEVRPPQTLPGPLIVPTLKILILILILILIPEQGRPRPDRLPLVDQYLSLKRPPVSPVPAGVITPTMMR
jgi:hypothetical protein